MKKINRDEVFESYSEINLFYSYLKSKRQNKLSELLDANLRKKENQIFNRMEQNKIDYTNALEKLYCHYDEGVAVVDRFFGKAEYDLLFRQEEMKLLIDLDRKQKALFDMVKRIRGRSLIEELNRLERINSK